MNDDDKPASPEELEAARRLAAALEQPRPAAPLEQRPEDRSEQVQAAAEVAGLIRAAAGRAAPLGELRARALMREATRAPRRPRRIWPVALPLLAVALLLLILGLGRDPVPERLRARSAGLLVPGPFPARQTAAQRLDRVTDDRLIALREARCRAVSRGAP